MAHPVRIRYWSAVIAEFRRSGLTQVEFCRRRQISLHSFTLLPERNRHMYDAPMRRDWPRRSNVLSRPSGLGYVRQP